MKIVKRLLTIVLAGVTAISVAACTKKEDNSKITVLEVAVHNGGVGDEWLQAAADRFSEQMKDHSYANGKTGVKININPGNGLGDATMASQAYNVYFVERLDTFNLIQNNLLMDLSEVFESEENGVKLESRIYPEMLPSLKGNDNKYYVLPGWEFYPGLSYDVDSFKSCGAYFVAPGEPGIEVKSDLFGTATLIGKNGKGKKSCGPDGEFATDDDGLPSSLQEMLILCEYLKSQNVDPICITGEYPGYSKYLIAGLWASLAGYDQMKTCYTFDGTMVEVVKCDEDGELMFTDENLFPNISYLKKPVTEMVSVDEAHGYYSNDMAAKYYAAAFLEIIMKEGFLVYDDGNHTANQYNFLLSGSGVSGTGKRGMIIDGSYWWVESEMKGNFTNYTKWTKKNAADRNIKWMPLPVSLDTTVTEGNGRQNTLIDTGMGVCFVNNNIKDNAELKQASLDFVKFCYSQKELAAFTEATGSMRPLNYDVNTNNVQSVFYKDLLSLRNKSKVVLFTGDNNIFKYNRGTLKIELGSQQTLAPSLGGKKYDNFLVAYDAKYNAVDVFNATRFTSSYWSTKLQ